MISPSPLPCGMIIVSSFNLDHNTKTGVFTIITDETSGCPLCDSELTYRDSKHRNLKDLYGKLRRFLLRRMRCKECNKLHTELPNIIQPYKHYESYVIQCILDESEEASKCAADDSTIRRWKKEFSKSAPDIA